MGAERLAQNPSRTQCGRRLDYGIFPDDMTTPVQTANDKTFGLGYVGVGSFDDLGMVRNIKIYGPSSEAGNADFFKASSRSSSVPTDEI